MAVVIDPVQSVKGKVVMDAFRSIDPQVFALGSEPRITTANTGMLSKPSREAKMRGLNKIFYSISMSSRTNDELEVSMLEQIYLKPWFKAFSQLDLERGTKLTLEKSRQLVSLTREYNTTIEKEVKIEKQIIGKKDPKLELVNAIEEQSNRQIEGCLTLMLNSVVL